MPVPPVVQKGQHHPTCPYATSGEPGAASGAAGEATIEEGYCKAKVIAMARLVLLLMPLISKIIC